MPLNLVPAPLPVPVRLALERRGLMDAFEARPTAQRNEYLGWVGRARSTATRDKRLAQMLDELEDGDIYMKARWRSGVAG